MAEIQTNPSHAGDTDITVTTVPSRETGYEDSSQGRRFYITHQTPGTEITAQATYASTTPTLILYAASGTAVCILRTVRIAVASVTADGVKVAVVLDTASRWSAGGTAVTPRNVNSGSAAVFPTTIAFRYNPTATAAGAGTRVLWNDRIPAGINNSITLDFQDAVILSGAGSILVYVYDDAGTTAPTLEFNLDVAAYTPA